MKYMTVLEASKRWGVSDRRVRLLCSQGRIRGIIQQGRRYLIPDGTEKPVDGRIKRVRHNNDAKHYNDFTRIDFLKAMLADHPQQAQSAKDDLTGGFMVDFIYSNNALEGNSLSRNEVDQVLAGKVIPDHPLKEHLQVIGVKDAWLYVLECVEDKKPLSQNVIRTIHSLVLIDDAQNKGKYRKVAVKIQGAESSPVFLELMEPRVNDLLNNNTQRKKVIHPVERIARFHLEFAAIHPFSEGNNRVARLLLNLELMQNGYPPIFIKKEEEKDYANALEEYFDHHQPQAMVSLIRDHLEDSLERTLAANRRKGKKNQTN